MVKPSKAAQALGRWTLQSIGRWAGSGMIRQNLEKTFDHELHE
jgi:hypothetical protein